MEPYTYAIGEFVTVESDVEVFLFDVPPRGRVPDPDVVIRETAGGELAAEWTGGQVRIAVPPSLPTEKTSSAEPVEFTKALLSAIDHVLLRRGAALAFGAALRTPAGIGVGIFGDSGCGKSTAAVWLARRRQYRLLADDLLVPHGGTIHPFPRHVTLPRDVPAVAAWVRSGLPPSDRIRRWDDEIDVPRALVSEAVPDRVDLDYVVLVDPDDAAAPTATPEPEAVPTARATAALAAWNRANLAGWTSHPAIRDSIEDPGTGRRERVREAIAGADCYRLAASKGRLPRAIADLVEP